MGVEALARWHHPQHGFIAPEVFIAIAERSGLIRPLTECVLDIAVGQVAQWRAEGFELDMAVNISTRNLLDERAAPDGRGRAGPSPCPRFGAHARDHREHDHRRPGPNRRDAEPLERHGRRARHRRLRHGLLVVVVPAPAARRRDQDRQVVRAADDGGRERFGHRSFHHRPRPQPRPPSDRRGRRGRADMAAPGRRGLRPSAGLLPARQRHRRATHALAQESAATSKRRCAVSSATPTTPLNPVGTSISADRPTTTRSRPPRSIGPPRSPSAGGTCRSSRRPRSCGPDPSIARRFPVAVRARSPRGDS